MVRSATYFLSIVSMGDGVMFEVGQTVRIREWGDMKGEFGIDGDGDIPCNGIFTRRMKSLCGKEFVIGKIGNDGHVVSCGEIDGYIISTDMIEPIDDLDSIFCVSSVEDLF